MIAQMEKIIEELRGLIKGNQDNERRIMDMVFVLLKELSLSYDSSDFKSDHNIFQIEANQEYFKTLDSKSFLLKEYEQISTAYHSSTDRRYSLLRLYFLIVAFPISIFSIIYNFISNNIISIDYGKLFISLFLFIIVLSGFFIFNSLISIHITKVIYAKTINKIRGFFVERDNENLFRSYIILPINDDKPLFLRYGSLFYDCMLISMLNSIITGISLYIFLNYFSMKSVCYPVILFIVVLIVHFIVYYFRLKKQDDSWIKKRDIFT